MSDGNGFPIPTPPVVDLFIQLVVELLGGADVLSEIVMSNMRAMVPRTNRSCVSRPADLLQTPLGPRAIRFGARKDSA